MTNKARNFSLQELLIVIGVMMIVLAIAVPNYLSSRAQSLETSAYQGLRAIHASQELHIRQKKKYSNRLKQLGRTADLDPKLATGERSGFRFGVSRRKKGLRWAGGAAPAQWGVSGSRCFIISQEGVIYFSTKDPGGIDGLMSHSFFKSFDPADLEGWSQLGGGAASGG